MIFALNLGLFLAHLARDVGVEQVSDHPRVGRNGSASARASRMDFFAVVVGYGRPGLGWLAE